MHICDHDMPAWLCGICVKSSAHGSAVYHVTEKGWTKVRGNDVGQLHFDYYPAQEAHPCYVSDPI